MSRNRRNRPLIPGTEKSLEQLKIKVMKQEGFSVNPVRPNRIKYEVAKELGVPLHEGYNGNLSSAAAGKVGGQIGGAMVKEMIKMAQERLSQKE